MAFGPKVWLRFMIDKQHLASIRVLIDVVGGTSFLRRKPSYSMALTHSRAVRPPKGATSIFKGQPRA
jgi:hypothetical protein